jgi:hypothetical protein
MDAGASTIAKSAWEIIPESIGHASDRAGIVVQASCCLPVRLGYSGRRQATTKREYRQ